MDEEETSPRATGRCLCGAVRYRIFGPMRDAVECRCAACRRVSGGVWHGTAARRADVDIHDPDGTLTWYRSSPRAERGFCGGCGSNLFFRRDESGRLSIAGGSLDKPSGIKMSVRIFTDDDADYAQDTGELPSYPTWPPAEYFEVPDGADDAER